MAMAAMSLLMGGTQEGTPCQLGFCDAAQRSTSHPQSAPAASAEPLPNESAAKAIAKTAAETFLWVVLIIVDSPFAKPIDGLICTYIGAFKSR